MQAITDELIEILASRHQAGSRGYGCRVEIDFLVPGTVEIGEEQNLAPLLATVTAGAAGSGAQAPKNPTYANDGNSVTYCQFEAGGAGGSLPERWITADMGSAVEISSFTTLTTALGASLETRLATASTPSPPNQYARFKYSTDNVTYTDLAVTKTSDDGLVPVLQEWAITGAPITARYFRLYLAGKQANNIWLQMTLYEWGIVGVIESEVSASLGTAEYRVTSCSLDKSRRLTAGQADIEIAIADDAGIWLEPTGALTTNARIRIYQWYGSIDNEVLVFTGSIDEIREGRDVRHLRITARDMMKRLIEQNITLTAPQGVDEDGAVRTTANYVYLNMDVDAILDDLLDKAGVPTADREIAATSYALDEFLGSDGASFAETIIGNDRLTGLTGYDLWADELGVLHFGPALISKAADSDTDPVPTYSYVVADYVTGEETSGLVTRLDRSVDEYELRTRVKVRGNIAIATPAWTEEWSSGVLTKPVGTMYLPADPTHIYVLDSGTKRIYKIRQSDRAKITSGIWPKYVGGDATYPIGLSRDPADADRFWVLEAPYWTTGATTGNKIHKYDLSDGTHLAEYSIAAGKWTSIKVSSANIWLANWTTDQVHKHSKVDGSAVASYTVTYLGVPQVNPTGIAVDGTTLLVFFYGSNRFLILDESDPTTIDPTNALGVTSGKISTAGTKIMGGEVDTATHAHLHANSDALGRIWKFTLTEPDTDEVFAEVVDTDLEDELGFLMTAADREHDSHPAVADHAYEIRRETLDIHKLLSNIAQATETAARRLDLLAHRQETLDVGTVGNPALQRNDLLGVTDQVTGIDASYVIDTLRSNMDTRGFFMTLALLPYSPAW